MQKIRRILRIFSFCLQDAFQYRSRALVWFILGAFNTTSVLIIWVSAFNSGGVIDARLQLSELQVYYILLLLVTSVLMSHIEEDVAVRDIKEGGLVRYLLRPFSYFGMKLLEESPWRLMEGFYGLIIMTALVIGMHLPLHGLSLAQLPLVILVLVGAFFISFIFKMTIGLVSFWIVDGWALFEVVEVVLILAAGNIMPLEYLPPTFRVVAQALPFAYFVYYPIKALMGVLDISTLVHTIIVQIMWICILGALWRWLWKKGVEQFTGVGQ